MDFNIFAAHRGCYRRLCLGDAAAEHEDLLRGTPRHGPSLCGRTPELWSQAATLSKDNPIGFDVTSSSPSIRPESAMHLLGPPFTGTGRFRPGDARHRVIRSPLGPLLYVNHFRLGDAWFSFRSSRRNALIESFRNLPVEEGLCLCTEIKR